MKAVQKGVTGDASGTKTLSRSITDRWDQDHIFRTRLQAEGRTWRHVVLWDGMAVNEDKSIDPRYGRRKTEEIGTMERFEDRKFRQIGTSHKGSNEFGVCARIATHGQKNPLQDTPKTKEDAHSLLGRRNEK